MVGVPGRSKGCVTCRKRKKGCDLVTPICGPCKERGIPCGGYDTDRVFVHQVGSPKNASRTPGSRRVSAVPQAGSQEMQMVLGSTRYSASQPRPISIALPDYLMRSAYSEKSIETFINMYTPGGSVAVNEENRGFMNMLPLLSIRDPALQMAILAMGTAVLSQTTNDEELRQRSRSFYSKALTETAVGLQDPSRAKSEAFFAVPRVMALYEILFGFDEKPTTQAKSWLSHAMGEAAMIISRRPEEYAESDELHALFISARFRAIIPAVRTRKASIMDEPEWKTLPWKNRVKTPNDLLVDMFCAIPGLLQATDEIDTLSQNGQPTEDLQLDTIARCYNLHTQLTAWLQSNNHLIFHDTLPDSPHPITFPTFSIACTSLKHWTLSLLLYSSLDIASGIPPSLDSSLSHPSRPHPRPFARLIARSAPYFFQLKFGIEGATLISFPVGNALLYMKRNVHVDASYMAIVWRTWSNPQLPEAIKAFLESLGRSVVKGSLRARPMGEL